MIGLGPKASHSEVPAYGQATTGVSRLAPPRTRSLASASQLAIGTLCGDLKTVRPTSHLPHTGAQAISAVAPSPLFRCLTAVHRVSIFGLMRRTCARLVALPSLGSVDSLPGLGGVRRRFGAEDATASLSVVPTPFECPITRANGNTPPGEQPSEGHHGNGDIWTVKSGSVYVAGHKVKFPWSHTADGVLTVEGPRLDVFAEAIDLVSSLNRSDDRSRPFHASYLLFPSAGCWEVTASVGDTSLSLVVRAIVN